MNARANIEDSHAKGTRWKDKDVQILAAAERIFLTRGYAEGSMNAIAQEGGISKQTLYHHYGGKAELFRAVVESKVVRLLNGLSEEVVEDRAPREVLTDLGALFLEMVVAPESVALHRALVTEVPRQPGLGQIVYDNGPARAVSTLAGYLRRQTVMGRLRIDAPELAAEQFFGMTLGHCQLRALFGVETDLAKEGLRTRVGRAVDVFLSAYGEAEARSKNISMRSTSSPSSSST